jgi:hypothetical protein
MLQYNLKDTAQNTSVDVIKVVATQTVVSRRCLAPEGQRKAKEKATCRPVVLGYRCMVGDLEALPTSELVCSVSSTPAVRATVSD